METPTNENSKKWAVKVSVTNDCNMNCFYCNDAQRHDQKERKVLDTSTARTLLQGAAENGFQEVQWTGGEPTVVDLPAYARIAQDVGFTRQALTSNGILLAPMLDEMQKAGLKRANISLDTLNTEKFAAITGGSDLPAVLRSAEKCARDLELFKLNVATMRMNIDEIPEFVRYVIALGREKTILKLHELWRFAPPETYHEQHVPAEEILQRLSDVSCLEPVPGTRGNNPSINYYQMVDNGVRVAISAVPKGWRCGGPECKKLRIYVNGKTCEGRNLIQLAEGTTTASNIEDIVRNREAGKGRISK